MMMMIVIERTMMMYDDVTDGSRLIRVTKTRGSKRGGRRQATVGPSTGSTAQLFPDRQVLAKESKGIVSFRNLSFVR